VQKIHLSHLALGIGFPIIKLVPPDLLNQLQASLGAGYRIERELGGGGMSRVFLATEQALERRVVIKVLPPDLALALSGERFRREIQLAAQLQHPHIVPLLTAGELPAGDATPALPYFTMPYVEGESLRVRLARAGELPIGDVVHVLREVALALAYAHEHGVIHRDIKPDNVLLSGGAAMVTDFGVAKALSASTMAGSEALTSTGLAIGTPTYMAPEQAAGDPGTDHRADLYAFGVLAYELVTGQPPFAGRSAPAVLAAHATESVEPVIQRRPACPPALAAVIMRCLEKRPADRPQSAQEIVRQLDSLSTPSALTPAGPVPSGIGPVVRGRVARYVVGAAVLAALLAVAAYWKLETGRRLFAPEPAGEATSAAGPAEKSIAVLPFVNMSADPENEYFSDGMTEELIAALGRVPGLRVAARSSAFAFKGKSPDVQEVGARLKVASVLEGSVRRSGSQLRLSAELVNVRDGLTIWSDTYARDLKDLFQVQDELARSIASALQIKLGGSGDRELVRPPTADLEAHTLYLQGIYQLNRRTEESLRQAQRFFEQAIARDSTYADAWIGLGSAHLLLGDWAFERPVDQFRLARQAARRVLALDSMSSGAHMLLGALSSEDYDRKGAEPELRKAVSLDPANSLAQHWYAFALLALGRSEEAVAQIRSAQALDPLSLPINRSVARILAETGRDQEAIAQAKYTLSLDSTFRSTHEVLGVVYLAQGRWRDAVAEFEADPPSARGELEFAQAKAGKLTPARRALDELSAFPKDKYVDPNVVTYLYLAVGDREHALRWLEKAYEDRALDRDLWPLPIYEELRGDPRYLEVRRKMGLK